MISALPTASGVPRSQELLLLQGRLLLLILLQQQLLLLRGLVLVRLQLRLAALLLHLCSHGHLLHHTNASTCYHIIKHNLWCLEA